MTEMKGEKSIDVQEGTLIKKVSGYRCQCMAVTCTILSQMWI